MKLRNILYTTPIILITVLTLILLTYVGLGEAHRRYLPFQLAKLATQGEVVENAFAPHLKAGLALNQFAGFGATADAILRSDKSIENVRVTDVKGRIVFMADNQHTGKRRLSREDVTARVYQEVDSGEAKHSVFRIDESAETYKVVQLLDSKFGVVGRVHVEARKDAVTAFLREQFRFVFYLLIGLSLAFALFVIAYEGGRGERRHRQSTLQFGFVVCFMLMSLMISFVVFSVYEHGAKSSTRALADVMSQRLQSVLELGVELDDLTGINKAMSEYRKGNPDINSIALIREGVCIAHTDSSQIGTVYETPAGSLEYVNQLAAGGGKEQQLRVAVTIPREVILRAVLGSTKTFIVLFVACLLFSLIFLNAGTSLMRVAARAGEKAKAASELSFKIGLRLIQPAYFLVVFVHALSISFLPQLAGDFAAGSNHFLATASFPFTVYYLVFAMVLLPAGHLAERMDLKKLMAAGFVCEVVGLALVAMAQDYWQFTIARGLSGCGQGLFLIGLQSYVTAVTPKEKRSLGHSVKVIGRNSALIAGTAIGALLFAFMDYKSLFVLASVVSLVAMIYLLVLVPSVERLMGPPVAGRQSRGAVSLTELFRNILSVIHDAHFMRTLLLIGVTGKVAIAGVVMFAVPLLLSAKGYETEDIGLALMLFYIFSILATHWVTRVVDREGATTQVLVSSALLCALALILLGIAGNGDTVTSSSIPGFVALNDFAVSFNALSSELLGCQPCLVLMSIVLVGVANGLLSAPVMTHINHLEISERNGVNSVAATYVFLERFGHVIGPVFIGQLLLATGNSTLAITVFGILVFAFGLAFALLSRYSGPRTLAVQGENL